MKQAPNPLVTYWYQDEIVDANNLPDLSSSELSPNPFPPLPEPNPPLPRPPLPEPLPLPKPPRPWPIPDPPFPEDLIPRPFPFPQKEWWKFFRTSPVSGRYQGSNRVKEIDLRLDVDRINRNTPVMKKVSGDMYRVFAFNLPGHRYKTFSRYTESWIVNEPNVSWGWRSAIITGDVSFYSNESRQATLEMKIEWNIPFRNFIATEVIIREKGMLPQKFDCRKTGTAFREVSLEVDVCTSVDIRPILPSYPTLAHNNRPSDVADRNLTLSKAFLEAGIDFSIRQDNQLIDDSAATFDRWSAAELHDAMEDHYSQYVRYPRWKMWGLLAGSYDDLRVGGIMFDARAAYGGAGDAPERQGFAVFRNHRWFDNLVENPSTQDEFWAMRHFLYTWVHEAGHAFNFLHSWNKDRPESLSWMNYDHRYDDINGENEFWNNFLFRFDEEELIHIRHGNRDAVIMGGDSWSSGGHHEDHTDVHLANDPEFPVQLDIRHKSIFEFMEPVAVELRLKNSLDIHLAVDEQLHPQFGNVEIFIQTPTGKITHYEPAMLKLGTVNKTILEGPVVNLAGADRNSSFVEITYGKDGFYFSTPGTYRIKAVYNLMGVPVVSNLSTLRVAAPRTETESRLAQDFFSQETGMALYLGGSQSQYLASGMDTLRAIHSQVDTESALVAKLSKVLASSTTKPFHALRRGRGKKATIKEVYVGDAEAAMDLLQPALSYCNLQKARENNFLVEEVGNLLVDILLQQGDEKSAKAKFSQMTQTLAKRGVNESVIKGIKQRKI